MDVTPLDTFLHLTLYEDAEQYSEEQHLRYGAGRGTGTRKGRWNLDFVRLLRHGSIRPHTTRVTPLNVTSSGSHAPRFWVRVAGV